MAQPRVTTIVRPPCIDQRTKIHTIINPNPDDDMPIPWTKSREGLMDVLRILLPDYFSNKSVCWDHNSYSLSGKIMNFFSDIPGLAMESHVNVFEGRFDASVSNIDNMIQASLYKNGAIPWNELDNDEFHTQKAGTIHIKNTLFKYVDPRFNDDGKIIEYKHSAAISPLNCKHQFTNHERALDILLLSLVFDLPIQDCRTSFSPYLRLSNYNPQLTASIPNPTLRRAEGAGYQLMRLYEYLETHESAVLEFSDRLHNVMNLGAMASTLEGKKETYKQHDFLQRTGHPLRVVKSLVDLEFDEVGKDMKGLPKFDIQLAKYFR
jgi:hypothetical protein